MRFKFLGIKLPPPTPLKKLSYLLGSTIKMIPISTISTHKLIDIANDTFPLVEIFIPLINFSEHLAPHCKKNFTNQNRTIQLNHPPQLTIQKIPDRVQNRKGLNPLDSFNSTNSVKTLVESFKLKLHKLNASQTNKSIINLSKTFTLTPAQESLLNKGLTFTPSTTPIPQATKQTKLDIQKFHRAIKLADIFHEENDSSTFNPFRPTSIWEPPTHNLDPFILELIEQDKQLLKDLHSEPETPNLTKEERKALKELKQNDSIIIKPADKGSAIVIMDKKDYIQEGMRQLSDTEYYKQLQVPIYTQTKTQINSILKLMQQKRFLTSNQVSYLQSPPTPRPRFFYLLPKIHKKSETWPVPHLIPPGRPIVLDCSRESYGTAQLMEYYLAPLSTKQPS